MINLIYYFFVLESEGFPYDLEEIMDSRIDKDIPLTKLEVEKFINDNKSDDEQIYNLNNNKLQLKYQGKEYEFNYKNYNKLLFELLRLKDKDYIEQAKWNNISVINYFDEEDLLYMKRALKNILQSKLFKAIYSHYFNENKIIDYYFDENANLDDLLNRIIFISYKQRDIGRLFGAIKKELKIIISSYYMSKIDKEKDFITCKILEMARKIILLLDEIIQFIKIAMHLLSNWEISEAEKETLNIIEEEGIFELVIFNRKNPFKKRPKNLNKRKGKINEEKEFSKKINVEKALKILDKNYFN